MPFKYYYKEPDKPYEIRTYNGEDKDMSLSKLLGDKPSYCKAILVKDDVYAFFDEDGSFFDKPYNLTLNDELDIYGNIIMFRETKSKARILMEQGVSMDDIGKMFDNGTIQPDEGIYYADVPEYAIELFESKASDKQIKKKKGYTKIILDNMYNSMLNFLGIILEINTKEWKYELVSNLEDGNNTEWYPATMIRPDDLDIKQPIILINDNHQMMKNLFNETEIFGILAHEARHLWQFFNNKLEANEQINGSLKGLGAGEKEITDAMLDEYLKSEIELDAYAFQIAFLRAFYNAPKLNLEAEAMTKFPDDMEERIQNLYNEYKEKIKNVKKVSFGDLNG